jgi:hypothetical protein
MININIAKIRNWKQDQTQKSQSVIATIVSSDWKRFDFSGKMA